jgi:hypothetical protein
VLGEEVLLKDIATDSNNYELTEEDVKGLSLVGFNDKVCNLRSLQCEDFYVGVTEKHTGLFYQLRGKESAPNRVPDGTFNMVNEISTNNGVTKKASSSNIFKAPAITVSVNFAKNVFLQTDDFCASVNILILKRDWLEKYIKAGLYVVTTLIKTNLRYDYSCKISKDKLNDTVLSLPIKLDRTGQPVIDTTYQYHSEGYIPDWEYMENYMKDIEAKTQAYLSQITSLIESSNGKIDIESWQEFKVSDLFDIHPTKTAKSKNGKNLSNHSLFEVDGKNPVVVNSAYENGVGGYTNQESTEQGGMLTFSDTVDANTIFYQPTDFVGYSHVQGLYPIGSYKDKWSEYSLKFFASVFRCMALSKGFDYGYKFRRDIALELTIKLPVNTNGNPDWNYMENYMKDIEAKASQRLDTLQALIEENK